MIVLRPGKFQEKLPAVIVLHGTGGTMYNEIDFMEDLAKRNIIGVAIDARYHGERSGGAKGAAAYVEAITRAWRTKSGQPMEHPFFYDTCWDLWRTTDYLLTRPDVAGDKLGMIGFSMGGIETWLAAAVDDRIKVAVPAIGVQSFSWSLENDQWQGRARTIMGPTSPPPRTWVNRKSIKKCAGPYGTRSSRVSWNSSTVPACCAFSRAGLC